jgi:16S rRNA G966 N2-methylase RsmD
MELTTTINSSFSRTRGNELNKGYYPTFPSDVQTVLRILEPSFGWKSRRYNALKTISVLDPCAGEGEFLATVTRWLKKRYAASSGSLHEILSYAVELDTGRFARIHGTTQKLNASFFDVEISGKFNLILLNPPYNKAAGNELVTWMEKSAPLLAYEGVMILIIPEYELKGRLLEIIRGTFPFAYAFQSEEYARFKQVVVFLAKNQDNSSEIHRTGKTADSFPWRHKRQQPPSHDGPRPHGVIPGVRGPARKGGGHGAGPAVSVVLRHQHPTGFNPANGARRPTGSHEQSD